ncbi:MAG: hypothetical protein GY842_06935 [bacterium]|nr:hypothetical protein [bacterium]
MTEKRANQDRRQETRDPRAGRIMWRKRGNHAVFAGWLSDLSPSSVSFVASARIQPGAGEEIEVIDTDRSRLVYRVARVAPYDSRLALIACRSAEPRRNPPPGSPVAEV